MPPLLPSSIIRAPLPDSFSLVVSCTSRHNKIKPKSPIPTLPRPIPVLRLAPPVKPAPEYVLVVFLPVVAAGLLKLSVVALTRMPLIVVPPTTIPPPPASNDTCTPPTVTATAPGTRVWLPTTYSDTEPDPEPESKLAVKGCVPIVNTCADGKNDGRGDGVIEGNEDVTPLIITADADGPRE